MTTDSPTLPSTTPAAAISPAAAGLEPPSVLILTRNEEANIEQCLRTVSFSDDIVVLDSHSTDRTVAIASAFPNVRVVQRQFDTEYLQRNFGFESIVYKHPWVYVCDADERIPESMREELLHVVNDPANSHSAFRIRYKNYFLGKWIKRSSGYPVWIIRLVRPEKVRYEKRATNVHPIVDGSTGSLRSHFNHYSFNSGLRRWFDKHNFYSDREAFEAVQVRKLGMGKAGSLFSADPMARRRAFKNLAFFLKGRAFWRFLFQYVLKFGFLDGVAGFHYCAMISMYEYWIELKIHEQERSWRERTEDIVKRRLAAPLGKEGSR